MANIRVKDLPNTNTAADTDEFIIDSSTAGTRRLSYSELKSEISTDFAADVATYGIATLDSDNKLTASQIPDSLAQGMNFVGVANSAGDLTSTTQGDFYVIQTAFGSYNVGDQAVYDGSAYVRVVDGTKEISEGGTGATTLDDAKGNLEIPDIGTAPNQTPLSGQLGSMAWQSAEGISVGTVEADGGITSTADGTNTQLKLKRTSTATGEFDIYTNTDKLYFKNTGDGGTFPLTLDGSKVGIGTSSPDRPLHSYASSVATALKLDSAGSDTGVEFAHTGTVAAAINCSTGGDLEFRTGANSGANERLRIDSSGRVGIGTGSPGGKLTIETGSGNGIQLYRSAANANFDAITFRNTTNTGTNAKVGFNVNELRLEGTTKIGFNTNGSERWVINSAGDLVSSGGAIDFGAVASGLGTVTPTTGGLLDDYETGTWTPVIGPNVGSFAGGNTYAYFAKYTKVGNLVTANCYINTTSINTTGGSGSVVISGLPFSSPSSSNYISVNVGYAYNWVNNPAGGYIAASTNRIILTRRNSTVTGNLSGGDVSDLSTSASACNEIMLSVTYQTT